MPVVFSCAILEDLLGEQKAHVSELKLNSDLLLKGCFTLASEKIYYGSIWELPSPTGGAHLLRSLLSQAELWFLQKWNESRKLGVGLCHCAVNTADAKLLDFRRLLWNCFNLSCAGEPNPPPPWEFFPSSSRSWVGNRGRRWSGMMLWQGPIPPTAA